MFLWACCYFPSAHVSNVLVTERNWWECSAFFTVFLAQQNIRLLKILKEHISCWMQERGRSKPAQLHVPGSGWGWRCIPSWQTQTDHTYTPHRYLYLCLDIEIIDRHAEHSYGHWQRQRPHPTSHSEGAGSMSEAGRSLWQLTQTLSPPSSCP